MKSLADCRSSSSFGVEVEGVLTTDSSSSFFIDISAKML